MIKKIIGRQRLASLPVTAVDKSRTSHRYFQITEFPRKFTAGRNVIKLRAKGNVLVPDSAIHVEILDANNKPIYYEVLNYVEKDGTRIIVVYIYPDTPPGIATVYLAGRARRIQELRTGNIPFSQAPSDPNYKDNPNIKWIRTIPVQPSTENTSEILFISASGESTSYPTVQISELTAPYLDVVHPSGSQFQTIRGSAGKTFRLQASPTTIQSLPDAAALQGQGGKGSQMPYIQSPFGKGVLKYGLFNRVPVNSLSPAIDRAPAEPFIATSSNSAQNARKVMQSQAPLEIPGIELPQIHASGFEFEPDMIGGKIVVNAPINIKTPYGTSQITSSYEATIVKLQSSTIANVTKPLNYTYKNPFNGQFSKIHSFEATTQWTASYSQKPAFFATQNTQSFANIVISKLIPSTGDIRGIRTYQRAVGSTGNYKLVNETEVEQQDVLIDETSLTSTTGMGILKSQSTINTYWKFTGHNGADNPTGYSDRSHLMEAMRIVPHGTGFPTADSYHKVQLHDTYTRPLYKGGPYYVEFDAKCFHNGNTLTSKIQAPRIDVYMSGSAFDAPSDPSGQHAPTYFLKDRTLGKFIGTIEGGSGSRFDNIQAHFEPDHTGFGTPVFVVRSGTWYLSEIHLYPNRQEGFAPSTTRILVPVGIEHMHTAQEFKIKYYDYNGKAAKHESKMAGCIFTGANFYIQGGSNLLTGSVFIGNAVGSGIELAGVSSAFIRSIGYEGFDHASAEPPTGGPGFMLYSGSVLPNSTTTYDGVGLELIQDHDNYFRFRTKPEPELDIRTKKFFLGSTGSFVSGSGDGTIAISSSNFELSTAGDVTMQGTITAEAGGSIGGWIVENSRLVSDSSPNQLSLSGSGEISSSYFYVDVDGNMTASSAHFRGTVTASIVYSDEGGIGGWNISSEGLSDENNNIGLFPTGPYVISSSKFQVNPQGSITASSAYISGSNIDLLTDKFYLGNQTTFISGSAGNIKISGSNIDVLTDKFFFGNASSHISGSNGNILISGSNVEIASDTFYLGSTSQYVSGSQGNIEISSSGFHLDKDGNVSMQGVITATAGAIGGATIGSASLAYQPYWEISASADLTDDVSFISSSYFKVSADGRITASAGLIGGATIEDQALSYGDSWKIGAPDTSLLTLPHLLTEPGSFISSSTFKVNVGGVITASAGLIGGWDISPQYIFKDGIRLGESYDDSGQTEIRISSDGTGGGTSNFARMYIDHDADTWGIEGKSDSNTVFHLGEKAGASDNQIAGWNFNESSLSGGNMHLSKDGIISSSDNWHISSSKYGPDPVGFISSSNFKVSADGRITASAGQIAGWKINGTNLIGGSAAGDFIMLAGDSTPKVKISPTGVTGNTTDMVNMYYDSAGAWGMKGLTNGNAIFQLGSTNEIAGWTFDNEKIYTTGVHLSASYGLRVFEDANNEVNIRYEASDNYGIIGRTGGNVTFCIRS